MVERESVAAVVVVVVVVGKDEGGCRLRGRRSSLTLGASDGSEVAACPSHGPARPKWRSLAENPL